MYLLLEKIHSSSVKEIKLDNSCNFSDPQERSSAFNDHVSSIGRKLINAIQQNGDTPSYLIIFRRSNIDSNSKRLAVQQFFLYYLNFVNLKSFDFWSQVLFVPFLTALLYRVFFLLNGNPILMSPMEVRNSLMGKKVK